MNWSMLDWNWPRACPQAKFLLAEQLAPKAVSIYNHSQTTRSQIKWSQTSNQNSSFFTPRLYLILTKQVCVPNEPPFCHRCHVLPGCCHVHLQHLQRQQPHNPRTRWQDSEVHYSRLGLPLYCICPSPPVSYTGVYFSNHTQTSISK